jgi:uncharacterized protein (PEP-CTERM system associated)
VPSEVPSAPIAGWTFRPGIAIGAVYDTNVAITSAPASTRTTPSDTLFTFDPIGSLSYAGKRTSFSAKYRGTFRRYTQLSQLNGFDQHASADVERRATKRLTIFGQASYAKVPTTDEMELNGAPFRRAGSRHEVLGTGLSFRLSERDTLTARYDFTWVKFDRSAAELTGGIINGIRSDVSHALTDRFSVGVEGSYRIAHMDQGVIAPGRQLRFTDVGGTASYALAEYTKVTGAVGFGHLDDVSNATTRSGLYFRGALTHVALRSVFGVSYDRSFLPSFGFGGSNRSQEVRGWVDLPPIGHRVFVQGSGSWRRTEPFAAEALQLDTYIARATAGYAVSRWMRTQAFYIYSRQDSIVTGGEINRQRIGGEVVLSQPMRIR